MYRTTAVLAVIECRSLIKSPLEYRPLMFTDVRECRIFQGFASQSVRHNPLVSTLLAVNLAVISAAHAIYGFWKISWPPMRRQMMWMSPGCGEVP